MAQEPYFSVMLIDASTLPAPKRVPPMLISMMLHFYSVIGPYAPEECRTSPAYTKFVKRLLAQGLIERPSDAERKESPGWAYRATDKGRVWVEGICSVPLPVAVSPAWAIPS